MFASGLRSAMAGGLLLCGLAMLDGSACAGQKNEQVREIVRVESGGSYLGVEMEEVTAANMAAHKLGSERGVIVRRVEKDSPAEKAGLQEKDVILEYSGMPVFSTAQFSRMVRETPVGRKAELAVSRDGKKLNLSAQIGKREGTPEVLVDKLGDETGRILRFQGPGQRSFQIPLPAPRGNLGDVFRWRQEGPAISIERRPRLGVTLDTLTEQMGEFLGIPGKKGALVTSVQEGSPAAGKLKAGDVIVRADNESIGNAGDLVRLAGRKTEAAKMELKVIRDKKEISVSIELAGSKTIRSGYRL